MFLFKTSFYTSAYKQILTKKVDDVTYNLMSIISNLVYQLN